MNTMNRWNKLLLPIVIGGCLLVNACSSASAIPGGAQPTLAVLLPSTTPAVAQDAGQPVEYEITAQDAPIGTFRQEPLTLALRGDEALVEIPSDLPPEVIQTLQDAEAQKDPALYLLIYAGVQRSGGFSVQIDSLNLVQEADQDLLVARYHVQPPDPTQGASTAITFPYLVARIATDISAAQVRFESSGQ